MTPAAAMYERSRVLARILASVTAERKKRRARTLKTDRTLQHLVADFVAARRAAVEKYADAVGALVEIRVRIRR
jgi:hypothetical protein